MRFMVKSTSEHNALPILPKLPKLPCFFPPSVVLQSALLHPRQQSKSPRKCFENTRGNLSTLNFSKPLDPPPQFSTHPFVSFILFMLKSTSEHNPLPILPETSKTPLLLPPSVVLQ